MIIENKQDLIRATNMELGKDAFGLPIKFKKLHPDAKAPVRATDGACGWDLFMTDFTFIKDTAACKLLGDDNYNYSDLTMYHTGIAVEIPAGYVGLLFPRSSCYKLNLSLANSVGVIDSDYRGEICFVYRELNNESGDYGEGDRIGQLVIVPCPAVVFVEAEELSETSRGIGGFGSTGK